VIVDLGTGDGRAALGRAAVEPRAFVIGIDANAAGMAESSRRAARSHPGRGVANVMFLVEAAEALPGPLPQAADLVTITMPWGSLLRGVLALDDAVLRGVASIVCPGGRVEIVVSVVPADGVSGLGRLDRTLESTIATAWRSVDFELDSMSPVSNEDLRATRSSWARRLSDRPVWRLDLSRSAPVTPVPTRARGQDGRH
jgi:16S rRNA (adenine(1408)-N(1))-methyltransferase